MRWIPLSLITLMLTLTGGAVLPAQDFAPDPPGDRDPRGQDAGAGDRQDWRQARREEMRRKIEIIRIARLTQELNLDGETAARLMPLLTEFDQVDKAHKQSSAQLGRELKQLTDADPVDASALKAAIAKWWDNEAVHQQRRREVFEQTASVLSVEQQARLMLFVPRFQREVREIVREFVQRQRGDRPGLEGRRPQGGDRGGFDGPPPGGGPPPDGERWWEDGPPGD